MNSPALLGRLAGYRLAHATGRKPGLPVNLTVSVTYRCTSRCLTCDIWQKDVPNLSVDEYGKVFRSLDKVPIWVTVSGGDQFLRADLAEVVRLIRVEIEPSVINLPMNGLATQRVFDLLPKIARFSTGSQLVLNLSLDEIGDEHDRLRGAPRNYAKLLEVARFIHDLKRSHGHLVLGVHTVVSKHNVHRIKEIEEHARATFRADSYITEVAENRVELSSMGKDITPSAEEYRPVAERLKASIRAHRTLHPTARMVQSLRLEYYELTARTLAERRQVIPCYAGWASAHLAPDGHVWGCCTRAESLGNVRNFDYDFRAVWGGVAADAFRRSVKNRECACPLASASYTNLLLHPPSLAKVVAHMLDPRSPSSREDNGPAR